MGAAGGGDVSALLTILACLAGVFFGGAAVAMVSAGRRAAECAECRRRGMPEWRDGTE